MTLHPQMAAFLDQLSAAGMPPNFPTIGAAAARALGAARPMPGQGPDLERVEEFLIPSRAGTVPARLYVPNESPAGLMVYLHGGGWVLGTLDGYDPPLRHFAKHAGWAVLSIDYRLAPEHRFPAAVEDSFDAVRWAGRHLTDLQLPTTLPIAVGGDSAGGNLAAVIARLARDAGDLTIAAQLLIYPVTDADFTTPSYIEHREQSPLTGAAMQWFWDQYAPNIEDRADPRAAPLRADDLSGLPPTLMVLAGYDPLLTESERYADRLRAAGIVVSQLRYAGLTHGFFQFSELLPVAGDALEEIAESFRTLVPRAR